MSEGEKTIMMEHGDVPKPQANQYEGAAGTAMEKLLAFQNLLDQNDRIQAEIPNAAVNLTRPRLTPEEMDALKSIPETQIERLRVAFTLLENEHNLRTQQEAEQEGERLLLEHFDSEVKGGRLSDEQLAQLPQYGQRLKEFYNVADEYNAAGGDGSALTTNQLKKMLDRLKPQNWIWKSAPESIQIELKRMADLLEKKLQGRALLEAQQAAQDQQDMDTIMHARIFDPEEVRKALERARNEAARSSQDLTPPEPRGRGILKGIKRLFTRGK